jgi:hypothetical protein
MIREAVNLGVHATGGWSCFLLELRAEKPGLDFDEDRVFGLSYWRV